MMLCNARDKGDPACEMRWANEGWVSVLLRASGEVCTESEGADSRQLGVTVILQDPGLLKAADAVGVVACWRAL